MTKRFYDDEMETLRANIIDCLNAQANNMSSLQMLQVLDSLRIELEIKVRFDLVARFDAAMLIKENKHATITTASGVTNTYP